MEYTSIQELLSTPAENYFAEHIKQPYLRGKILHWLRRASDDIIDKCRHSSSVLFIDERVLISDIIRYPTSKILTYTNVSKLSVEAMNAALGINGLSLDMHPYQIAALIQNNDPNSDIDGLEKIAVVIRSLIRESEEGTLYINLGKEIFPGYECTLNFRKL